MSRLLSLSPLVFAASALAEPIEPPVSERELSEAMTVVRYVIEARVADEAGRPVKEIPPGEFEVTIGNTRAHVESADWISFESQRAAPPTLSSGAGQPELPIEGRLVVFFLQTDFARNASRIKGHMMFTSFLAEKVVGMLRPDDRVAVVAFDARLEILCDYTSDRAEVLRVIKDSFDASKARPARAKSGPSLLASIDPLEAKRAARGEEALLLVARALSKMEGDKLMFLAGWGFGEMIWGTGGGGQVVLPRAYSEAVGLLYRDRTPVVTIGTGDGQLTAGIALTARATGGLHTSAITDFPEQQLTRIDGFVAGSYELVLRTDAPLAPGEYPITVRTSDPRHQVRAAPSIVVDEIDNGYGEAIALMNAGLVADGVRTLRASMETSAIPRDVLVDRLTAFVDAAQWEAALVVVERLEATGAVDDDVARMRDEATRGAAMRMQSSARAKLTEARRLLLDDAGAGALALLDEAIRIDPRLGEAWYERGMLLLAMGRTDEAAASLERVLEIEPRGERATTAREVLAAIRR